MTKQWKACVIVVMTIGVVFGIVRGASAQATGDKVFAVVKMQNPDSLISQIGQFVEKVQPGMGAMVNTMMVGQMVFKNSSWAGMNMNGEYTVVVLNPQVHPKSPLAFVVPMISQEAYLDALSQTLTQGEQVEGVYNFSDPNTQKGFFAAFDDKVGVVGEDSEVVAQVKAMVEADSPALSQTAAIESPLTVFLAMDKILEATRPLIDGFKAQAFSQMQQQAEGAEEGAQQMQAVQSVLQAEVDAMLSLIEQTEEVQLGLDVQSDQLRLSKAVLPASGTTLEGFFAAQNPQTSSLLGVIPQNSGIIASGSLNFTPEFIEAYTNFTAKISKIAAQQVDPELTSKLSDWVTSAFKVFGGDFALGALNADTDVLMTQVYTVKDPAQAKQLIEQYPEIIQAMAGLNQSMGMEMNMSLVGTDTYSSGEILNFDFGLNATAIPDPQGQEVFNNIFGEGMTMPMGFIGNYSVFGLGKDARGVVEKTMDQLASGAEAAAEYTPATFGLPDDHNLFLYVSVPKIMGWAMKNIPDTPAIDLPEPGPGFAMSGRFVESHFEGQLVLPVEEILLLKSLSEQARQPQMPTPEAEAESK